MKKILFIFIYLMAFVDPEVHAQKTIFGMNIGWWNDDRVMDMDTVSNGIILTTTPSITDEENGLFKIDKQGNIIWSLHIAMRHQYNFLSTAVDEHDNIYSLVWHVTYTPEPFMFDSVPFYGGINLVKISPDGKLLWARKIGSQITTGAKLLYKNGHLYAIGNYLGTISIGNKFTLTSKSYYQCFMSMYMQGQDYFVAKFDTTGNAINAISLGEDYDDYTMDATIDNNENIYCTGISNFFICPRAYSYITKINSDLKVLWCKEISKETQPGFEDILFPSNIYYSKDGKLYLWGINSFAVVTPDFTLDNLCWTFDNGYTYAGNLLEFSADDGTFYRNLQLPLDVINQESGSGLYTTNYISKGYMTDFGNNLLVLTSFRNPMDLNGTNISPTINLTEDSYNQMLLLLQINLNDFTPKYINSFKGVAPSNALRDFAGPIIMDNKNCLYLSGEFKDNPIYVYGNAIKNNSGNNCMDILLCKIDFNSLLSTGSEKLEVHKKILIYPNPVNQILYYNYDGMIDNVIIYNEMGLTVSHQKTSYNSINFSNLRVGIYYVAFYYRSNLITYKKVIKQ